MILQWVGYRPWSRKVGSLFRSLSTSINPSRCQIRLNDWQKVPQRIKLEKLATEVAKCIERFIIVGHARLSSIYSLVDTIRGKDVSTTAGNHYDREHPDWRVGPGFIGIDRLVLIALDSVSRGSWQPRIGVLQE